MVVNRMDHSIHTQVATLEVGACTAYLGIKLLTAILPFPGSMVNELSIHAQVYPLEQRERYTIHESNPIPFFLRTMIAR